MIKLKDLLLELHPKVKKHRPGAWKVSLPRPDEYGLIKKVGRKYHAEIRMYGKGPQPSETLRSAGIWDTLDGAVKEVLNLGERKGI